MTGESPDLGGIVRRVDDEIRRRGAIGDTFGDGPHYTSDGRDGHDDYDCAAADRRALLGLLRECLPFIALQPSGPVGPDRVPWFQHGGIAHGESRPDCLGCQLVTRLAGLESQP